MPNTREKLIELLNAVDGVCPSNASCYDCEYKDMVHCAIPAKADYLIANGVTVQEWIPVTERLPEQTSRCFVARWDYVTSKPFIDILWYEKGVWWNRLSNGNYAVTHWMPLPEPPKGE